MPQLLPPQEPIHRRQKLFSVLIGSERGRWIRKSSVKAFEDPRARSRQPPGQVGSMWMRCCPRRRCEREAESSPAERSVIAINTVRRRTTRRRPALNQSIGKQPSRKESWQVSVQ